MGPPPDPTKRSPRQMHAYRAHVPLPRPSSGPVFPGAQALPVEPVEQLGLAGTQLYPACTFFFSEECPGSRFPQRCPNRGE